MRKRLICLLLAMVMLLSLCMTSCSSGEEEEGATAEEEVQRGNIGLTIYAIVGDTTTEAGLDAVEEKISNYCVAKYKTKIELRFVTANEYQDLLDEKYALQAEIEAAKKKAEEEAKKAAAEEKKKKAAMSREERLEYEQQKRLEKKKAEEEAKKKAEEEAELIEQGKDVAVIAPEQIDLLFIPDGETYREWVEAGVLLDLSSYLNAVYKNIKNYVYPAFITAATVNGGVYGIPNNRDIASKETFFVVKKDLASKYQVDWTKVRSISDLDPVFQQVKANERGVTPIYGDFEPEGLVFYDDFDLANTVCVFYDTLLGGRYNTDNVYSALNPDSAQSTAFLDYCAQKSKYRTNGWISETNENFFLSVQELNEAERKEWEDNGYITVLYKGAEFNTEDALSSGLFGISKYCTNPDRAMEILQLITNDTEFRNLLAFGVEEVNYIKTAGRDNTITMISDTYAMDFFHGGNVLNGYILDTMDPNYIEYAKQKNLNSRLDPFLGFSYDWSDSANAKFVTAFAEWDAVISDRLERLMDGVPNYMELLREIYADYYPSENTPHTVAYQTFQNECSFRSSAYKAHANKLKELDQLLHVPEIEYSPRVPAEQTETETTEEPAA